MDSLFLLILATTGRVTAENFNLQRIFTQKHRERLVTKLIRFIDLIFSYEGVYQERSKNLFFFYNFGFCLSFTGPLTNEAVMSINNFVNQREDLLATSVEDLEKSLLLYLCWTKLKNFCPLTGRLKKEEIILRGDSFLDRFEVQITFSIKSATEKF